jgi:hypothetical protein
MTPRTRRASTSSRWSFDEVQPLADHRALWWSLKDNNVLVDLAGVEEYNDGDNDDFKEKPEEPPETGYFDGFDNEAPLHYSIFYR